MLQQDPDERLKFLSPEEQEWIGDFLHQIRQEFGSRLMDVRVFGSRIRGESHPESDLDVLVLLQGCDWATWNRVLDIGISISDRLDVRPVDYEQYHSPRSRATGFYKEMREASVRL